MLAIVTLTSSLFKLKILLLFQIGILLLGNFYLTLPSLNLLSSALLTKVYIRVWVILLPKIFLVLLFGCFLVCFFWGGGCFYCCFLRFLHMKSSYWIVHFEIFCSPGLQILKLFSSRFEKLKSTVGKKIMQTIQKAESIYIYIYVCVCGYFFLA